MKAADGGESNRSALLHTSRTRREIGFSSSTYSGGLIIKYQAIGVDMHMMKIIGIVVLLGSVAFGGIMYMQTENFNPEEHSIYSGGNGTFTTVEKLGGMSVYIKADSISCAESDVDIYLPSTSDDSFWAGTSYFSKDCDDSWDVPNWTYLGLLSNTFEYEQGEQTPKLTGGRELTVEANVDVLVADHSAEDDAFAKLFFAIPGLIVGILLITIGGDDELEGGGANAVPVYGAATIGGQSGVQSGSQFTMPPDDQFGIAGDGQEGNVGMNPTAGQENMGMDYTDKFR